MQDNLFISSICISLCAGIAFCLASCVNTRQAVYFNGVKDTTMISAVKVPESVIQKNDILSIGVSSLNPDATKIFNPLNVSAQQGGASGYLVNEGGSIQFPVLGDIKSAGLTKSQLKTNLEAELTRRKLLIDPIVSIQFMNYRVTVLGEVQKPTVIQVPNERITLLEALGMAGDLTLYAKRNNVLLIREEGENRTFKHIDLNSDEIFSSPFYYLKSNDVIYVEPNQSKVASTSRSNQILPWLATGISVAILVLDRIIKK